MFYCVRRKVCLSGPLLAQVAARFVDDLFLNGSTCFLKTQTQDYAVKDVLDIAWTNRAHCSGMRKSNESCIKECKGTKCCQFMWALVRPVRVLVIVHLLVASKVQGAELQLGAF